MEARKYFALFMTAFYLLAGVVLLFTDLLGDSITRYRNAIGAILIAYGILRAVLYFTRRKSGTGATP